MGANTTETGLSVHVHTIKINEAVGKIVHDVSECVVCE